MQEPESHTLIDEVVHAGEDLTLSLRRVITGFIKRKHGADKWGDELAGLTEDDSFSPASQVAIHNNMLKLLAQIGGGGEESDLLSPEQIKARMRQIDAEMQEAEGDAKGNDAEL